MVNRTYQALLADLGGCDLHDARFLEDKLQAAVRLIRNVEQRRATLYRVAQLIIEPQSEFLNKGIDYLKASGFGELCPESRPSQVHRQQGHRQ